MDRVYDPNIFVQTLDGIDLTSHIIATYYMKNALPGEDFIDYFSLIQSMVLEGSTGTWAKIAEHTPEVREALSGRMVGYYEIPTDEPSTKAAVVQLAFPIAAWTDNLPMMLLSIAGNCFAFCDDLRLLDVFIPEDLVKTFKGPKFGIPGMRQKLGVPERPLSLHIIKPKMGMTPQQTADQVYQTAIGGVDCAKDDEMLSDAYNNKFDERLPLVMERIHEAKEKTGKEVIYFVSITHECNRILERAHRAVELGANGLLVCYSAGLSALRMIAEDPEINVPILFHPSHMIAAQPRIAWPVFAKLVRLCGADFMLTPTMWSSIPMVSLEEGIRAAQVKQAPLYDIKPVWPMPCAGVYPGLAEVLINEYGPDICIPAGGGMLGHPDSYTAGAQAWQQAIAAVMANVPLPDAARQPGNEALRHALEHWGYMVRPKTPWLRVAPKFHPKPMKFD